MSRVFYKGQTAKLLAYFRDSGNELKDPVSAPTVTIKDPNGVEVVTSATATKLSTGTWYYDYAIPSDAPIGLWHDYWTGTIEGVTLSNNELDFTVVTPSITQDLLVEKYISKTFVINFYELETGELTDEIMIAGSKEVNSHLREHGFEPDNYDKTYDELFMAALYFIGEELSKKGYVTWTVGQIEEERFGSLSRRFPRWQPMFFFARGMAKHFYGLLPHQTYNMMAFQHIRRFTSYYDKDTRRTIAISMRDTSYRGFGSFYKPISRHEITEYSDMEIE